MTRSRILAGAGFLVAALAAAAPSDIETRQASTHPMRYHLSLPAGWSSTREWPVLVVIPDAGRDFVANLTWFITARGDRPYILVAPEVLTCGGAGSRVLDHYTYSKAVWDSLQGHDDFAFDDDGVAAVLADVRRQFRSESTAFLTGWEAGGHTVWALTFRHPERWRGVAPVCTNYQRRGLDPASFSKAPARAKLPIQVLREPTPAGDAAGPVTFFEQQTAQALADARAHGYSPNPVHVVPGAVHGPIAPAVLAWCDSVRTRH